MSRPIVGHETANAKINLALHVLGREADGFHQLDSLVGFAAISDHLSVEPAQTDGLDISGRFGATLKPDDDNLVLRALAAFRRAWPDAIGHGVKLSLTKNLPLSSGIGGGSADAAACLRLLVSIARNTPEHDQLMQVAANLGSDVPVCLRSKPARMRGRGEKIATGPTLPPAHIVLINPGVATSTPEVFARLTERENPPLPDLPAKFDSLEELAGWLGATRNDLEQPATHMVPQIRKITEAMRAHQNCAIARVSGSGATVFGLFENETYARNAATKFGKQFPDYWIADGALLA